MADDRPELEPDRKPVTELLVRWRDGDESALDRLMPLVQDELKEIARHYLRRERPGHTLQSTALINEAYLKLVDADVAWQDRVHFFAVASRIMRRVLVDYARAQKRDKRGGGKAVLSLDQLPESASASAATPPPAVDIVDLDGALKKLSEIDDRKSRVVELTYFGGLTYDETAEALAISAATVHRELRLARAWLQRELVHGG